MEFVTQKQEDVQLPSSVAILAAFVVRRYQSPFCLKLSVLGLTALLSFSFASISKAVEGRPIVAERKVSMCEGCHGIPGYRTSFPEVYAVPKLGGQHANYIVSALKAYRSGERDNTTMHSIAAGLSEQDMLDIAAYYSISN